jgi:hypothetical protein
MSSPWTFDCMSTINSDTRGIVVRAPKENYCDTDPTYPDRATRRVRQTSPLRYTTPFRK